ncbi:amino acid adenylation domain-containing protein [Bacillus sp. CLL-7-23]|uniref:Amino acid adenylation domain-containing protein n=1 Tax=Bacillus changyiensis TaxID=3004103 RepID=A0ABT4X2R5_9BACI|nr:non-ribosomal peptide synthetase [Bacillus changyiensis]MDA7026599.1 amino acid adenylation domain-containing protein [Bacillus changyiensis]
MDHYFPLTDGQLGIWYVEKMYPNTSISNNGALIQLDTEQPVRYDLISNAINEFIKKTDNIRLRILSTKEEKPVQYVADFVEKQIDIVDLNGADVESSKQIALAHFQRPLPLEDEDLFDFKVFKVSQYQCFIYVNIHHIISDAVSVMSCINEMISIYSHFLKGTSLHSTKTQSFIQQIKVEQEYKKSRRFEKDRHYWEKLFQSRPEMTSLKPSSAYRSSAKSRRLSEIVSKPLAQRLKEYSAEQHISLFNLFLAGVFLYISKMTQKKDIVIGTMFSNRTTLREKELFGMLVSTVPFRVQVDPTLTFSTFARNVSQQQLRTMRHQKYPYELLLNHWRNQHRTNDYLYTTSLQYLEIDFPKTDGITYDVDFLYNGYEINDLAFHIVNNGEDIAFEMDYRLDLFEEQEIRDMFVRILLLLSKALLAPQQQIGQLNLLTEADQSLYFREESKNRLDEIEESFQEIFQIMAKESPKKTAVICGDRTLSYQELDERSNQLAQLLRKKGVAPEKRVAILTNRTEDMIVGAIAVMKAGGAYVPIDAEFPEQRIQFILKDSHSVLLLTDQMDREAPVECIYFQDEAIHQQSTAALENVTKPDNLCYIIYTSGTTGNPKGVMIEHRNYTNMWKAYNDAYGFQDMKPCILQLASFSFDVFAGDMARTLLNQGTLVICPSEAKRDLGQLQQLIETHQITMLESTPALIVPLLDDMYEKGIEQTSLQLVVLGADSCLKEDFERIIKHYGEKIQIYNTYGVTEATIETSLYRFEQAFADYEGITPIGKPLLHMSMYIFSESMELLPPHSIGELYIGGKGVARGYLNNPTLTKERFISNPFDPSERLYKTGDQAKMLPDGNIQFLGRHDFQVKIRGHRIEIGEVEAKLIQHPAVRRAVVKTVEPKPNQTVLAAYLEANEVDIADQVKAFLFRELPDYMVPTYFIQLDQLPLTTNQKVNRQELPEPESYFKKHHQTALFRTALEAKLAEVWKKTLKVDHLTSNSDFIQLGFHSLQALALVNEIEKQFGIRLTLGDIFSNTLLFAMAKVIEEKMKAGQLEELLPAEESDAYPVTAAQEGVYTRSLITDANLFHMPCVFQIDGPLDVNRLSLALQTLVNRHESLRTSFIKKDDTLKQRVHPNVTLHVKYDVHNQSEIEELVSASPQPFSLDKPPLMRAKLIKIQSVDKHVLLLDFHHIIFDGMSLQVFMEELTGIYKGRMLPEPKLGYKDYAVWEKHKLEDQQLAEHRDFWSRILVDQPGELHLPIDFPRPALQSFAGNIFEFELNKDLLNQLKEFSLQHGLTLYMTLLSVYFVLLAKYTGQADLVVGTPTSGRFHPNMERTTGLFVNTLPVRKEVSKTINFSQFCQEVKQDILQILNYQQYPIDELVKQLKLNRDPSRNPLYQTVFALQDIKESYQLSEDVKMSIFDTEYNTSKVDLTLEAAVLDHCLGCRFEYSTSLFKKETIERLAKHFEHLIEAVLADPEQSLGELELLSKDEQALLAKMNDTDVPLPSCRSISAQFETQAKIRPDETAAIFKGDRLSYRELNSRANQLAHLLMKKGVGPDVLVGIMVRPSSDLLVGMLGVLKAGGAYVPIDPEYPESRIQYMLKDSQVSLLLTQSKLTEKTGSFSGQVINVDKGFKGESDLNPPSVTEGHHLAYMIYTSGSTGEPKGVLIEQHSVLNLWQWFERTYDVSPGDAILHMTNPSFDVSVEETLIPLMSGAVVVIAEKQVMFQPEKLINFLNEYHVRIAQFVPATLRALLAGQTKKAASLDVVICGGEKLELQLARQITAQGYKLYNNYGPTETTVDALVWPCPPNSEVIKLGAPIDRTRVYVLDQDGKQVPPGIPGELYIGGAGVARGYYNRPDQTKRAFVSHPNGRLYRTGDLVKWHSDQTITYLGRLDKQVKIRGVRIEPGEITAKLLELNEVKNGYVMAHHDENGQAILCAYLVTETEIEPDTIRKQLAKSLPDYMIPVYFITVDELPLTPNGKINEQLLPMPKKEVKETYEPPQTETEKILASIWEEVLDIDRISRSGSFFDYGGDSIKAIQISSQLRKHQLKLETKYLFTQATIAEAALYVEPLNKQIDQRQVSGEVMLSPIQTWFFSKAFADPHHYNQAETIYRAEGFDPAAIELALDQLMEHHDMFRAVFIQKQQQIVQKIRKAYAADFYEMKVLNLRDKTNWRELAEHHINNMQGELDIESGPLVKVCLCQTNTGDHLVIVIHHLIIDGVSWRIFLEDLETAYEQAQSGENIQLPEKTTSFKKWTTELWKYAQQEAVKEKTLWREVESRIAVPRSLAVRQSSDQKRSNSQQFVRQLDQDITNLLLKKVHHAYRTEINDILLAAFALAMRKQFGIAKLPLDLEGHGREAISEHVDVSRTIGWFTSVFPVVLSTGSEVDLGAAIKTVKDTLHRIPHKGIGYGLLHDQMLEETPSSVVSFNYLGQFEVQQNGIKPLHLGDSNSLANERTHMLDLNLAVINGVLEINVDYHEKEFDQSEIEALLNSYTDILVNIVNHCLEKEDHEEKTLSDFDDQQLTNEELDHIYELLKDM